MRHRHRRARARARRLVGRRRQLRLLRVRELVGLDPAPPALSFYLDATSGPAMARELGGVILWTVQQGATSPTGPNPPLAAVKAAFLP